VIHFIENLPRQRLESQTLFFANLSSVVLRSDSEFWEVVNACDFAQKLVNCVYLDSCSKFIEMIVLENSDCDLRLEFPNRLLQEIVSRSRNSLPSLRILKSWLDNERLAEEIAVALLSHIDQLLTETFKNRDYRLMDFLAVLYGTATASRHCAAWVRIADAIVSRYPEICEILSGTDRFCQFERSAGKVFLLISKDRGCGSTAAGQVVQRSLMLLFKFPSNSFLHNFAVSAVEMMVDTGTSIRELIEETHLVDQIIANYTNPQWDGRAFWGQLRTVSNLIDPYVNVAKYPDWDCVVNKANRRTEDLINRTDGFLGKVASIAGCTFLHLVDSPMVGKLVVWGAALFLILVVYASCAL
jgi:hypothetical protein